MRDRLRLQRDRMGGKCLNRETFPWLGSAALMGVHGRNCGAAVSGLDLKKHGRMKGRASGKGGVLGDKVFFKDLSRYCVAVTLRALGRKAGFQRDGR